eukprot:11727899-Prorocentrum_lima.AAC.1
MTSSLVGSEMCIRDSNMILDTHYSYFDHRTCSIRHSSVCLEAHSSGPVSYTHLTLPTICSV